MVSAPAGETERLNTEKMLTDLVEPFSHVTVSGNKVDRLQTPLFPHFISYNTMCLSTQCVCVCVCLALCCCVVCVCVRLQSVFVCFFTAQFCVGSITLPMNNRLEVASWYRKKKKGLLTMKVAGRE